MQASMEDNTDQNVSHCQVVIVGAGVSGLQCARSLLGTLPPEDLVVLEARNRIGGRVHTRSYTPPGNAKPTTLHIDDGAAWVHGVVPVPGDAQDQFHVANPHTGLLENPVLRYLNRWKDLNVVVEGNPWMRPYTVLHRTQNLAVFVEGSDNGQQQAPQPFVFVPKKLRKSQTNHTHTNAVIKASIRRHYQIMGHIEDEVDDLYDKGMGMEANTQISLGSCLDKWNQDIPISDSNDSQTILALTSFYQHLITTWQGLDLDHIPAGQYGSEATNDKDDSSSGSSESSKSSGDDSLLWTDAPYEQDGDFGGPHCTVKVGMQKVVQTIAAAPHLMDRVRLDHEVVQIQKVDNDSNYPVRVETQNGAVVWAKTCVVTLPVGCLRERHDTLFVGRPLTPNKQEALAHVTMGQYKKVFLTFDSIFWPVKPALLGMVLRNDNEHPLGRYLLVDNLWAKDGHACLEAILAGGQAAWATHKSDTVIRDAVLDFLQTAMGLQNLRDKCVECHITRWEEDPFSRGAYAGLALGGLNRHIEALREPEWDGSLYFAGDACSFEFEGSVPAAIMSGRYTARAIQEHLGLETTESSSESESESENERPEGVPRFENYSWRKLPPKVQQAATVLGYDQRQWDQDLDPPLCQKSWRRLTLKQQQAAQTLGYTNATWDES